MPKKGGRFSTYRISKSRKRRFSGNRFTLEKDIEFTITSAEKLQNSNYDDIIINPAHSYVIISFLHVFNYLSQHLQCKSCQDEVKFERTAERGLGFKLLISCKCSPRQIESGPLINQSYEINRRIIFVMRLLGVSLQGLNLFCSLMDLCNGFKQDVYNIVLENIYCAAKSVFHVVQQRAVKEEIIKNTEIENEPTHITVSSDDSWKKRGLSSLFGIATLVGKFSKKVIDVNIKSSFCWSCANWKGNKNSLEYEKWMETHENECSINNLDSIRKMKIDAVTEMFSRSEKDLGVKYVNYICDDTKTFKAIYDFNPYENIVVSKRERVEHVQKLMGTRLRTVKETIKSNDGKNASELIDELFNDLNLYYGLAITRHPDSVEDMKKAIWATFLHKCSTNTNPQHMYCPKGENSWCKWRVAEAQGTLDTFEHDPSLDSEVQKAIKPVYEELSNDDLLQRCVGDNIQNNIESLKACVWRLAPKYLHCDSGTVEIATYLAASIFNEGFTSIMKIMELLGIEIGFQAKSFTTNTDHISAAGAEATTSSKQAKMDQNEQKQQESEASEDLLHD